jgi:solute carrier family 32 (vesicular inhibitory amino acid transporter)
VEVLCGLDPRLLSPDSRLQGMSAFTRGIFKILIRVLVVALVVIIAIGFPDFDSIMALMGSALCFTICVILPVGFYLRIFGKEISLKERIFDWVLIIACSIMAVVGTVWACMPKEKIGAK